MGGETDGWGCFVKLAVWSLVLIFSGGSASAGSLESWRDFQDIVYKNRVSTVDELLVHLPAEYVRSFSLIYRTRALAQDRVSAARPRVLLFGENASFIIAYNSHPSGGKALPGEREAIETLAFDPLTGKSYLREIVFDGQVPDLSMVKTNPQKCLACHTQSPDGVSSDHGLAVRGLWDPYNSWSGVYGSLSRQGIDFIKLGTPEHANFQEFLAGKDQNPRYSFLPLRVETLSQLPDSAFIRGFDPTKAHDALTFSDGQSRLPNQILGMHLANQNFRRIGNILAAQSVEKRAAFQYLVKGISLDESYAKPDVDERTNSTNLNGKVPACLAKIDTFLPEKMAKVSFEKFGEVLLRKIRADYAVRKALAEVDNLGLSKLGAGFDPKDPFDENPTGRALEFDSINPASKFHLKFAGRTGNAALFYLSYLMGIPSQDLSTAVNRGTNFDVDPSYILSGSTALYYGNSTRCYRGGSVKSMVQPYDIKKSCFTEPVEEFFTSYLPSAFYEGLGQPLDPNLNQMTCDELAAKSRAALTQYFLR